MIKRQNWKNLKSAKTGLKTGEQYTFVLPGRQPQSLGDGTFGEEDGEKSPIAFHGPGSDCHWELRQEFFPV